MNAFSPRAIVPACLLVGFLAGCAHGRGSQASTPSTSTGPANTLTAEDIARTPNQPIEQLLGRFAGVTVMQNAAGGISIRIRGATSVIGSNEPLYVVNGIVIQAGPGGALVGLSAYDIESIEVLKDATSLVMYGARAANGVIVIRTKQPG